MEQTFFTGVNIEKVRHLENISIPLDKGKRKHLILTGKNGSGKTSVLKVMLNTLSILFHQMDIHWKKQKIIVIIICKE